MSAIEYDSEQQGPVGPAGEVAGWEDYEGESALPFPPRRRRRLWGRATAALLGVLLVAVGFYAGIRVEKGQVSGTSTSSPAAGSGRAAALAARFGGGAAGAAGGAAGAAGAGGAAGAAGARAGGGGLGSFGGAGGSASFGTVSSVSGNTIYIQTTGGNVVKVTLSSATKVTKSQGVSKKALKPGDTVVISGLKESNGSISATTVSDSGNRSASTGSSSTSSSSSSSGSSAVNSLFGSGG